MCKGKPKAKANKKKNTAANGAHSTGSSKKEKLELGNRGKGDLQERASVKDENRTKGNSLAIGTKPLRTKRMKNPKALQARGYEDIRS